MSYLDNYVLEMNVKFEHAAAQMPEYKHPDDAGADLCTVEAGFILPGETKMFNTGIVFEIPVGYEIQIRSRSGLAVKNNVFVLNSPGTIDTGYIDPVKVILHNAGTATFVVNVGDRIAQAVCKPVTHMRLKKVNSIGDTDRGRAGLGSTGVTTPPIEM